MSVSLCFFPLCFKFYVPFNCCAFCFSLCKFIQFCIVYSCIYWISLAETIIVTPGEKLLLGNHDFTTQGRLPFLVGLLDCKAQGHPSILSPAVPPRYSYYDPKNAYQNTHSLTDLSGKHLTASCEWASAAPSPPASHDPARHQPDSQLDCHLALLCGHSTMEPQLLPQHGSISR